MSLIRVMFGAIVGLFLVAILWFGAILQPPEFLSRAAAVWVATSSSEEGPAIIESIPCPVLNKLRFYVVCMDDCDSIWRIVGVWGLQPRILADLSRVPPERPGVARHRINAALVREELTLDDAGGREMIGCYMRLDGLDPSFILPAGGRASVETARISEDAMRDLAFDLDNPGALARLDIRESVGGFESSFEYWDVSLPDRPIVRIRVRIAGDGRMLGVERRELDRGGVDTDGQ